MDLKLFEDLVAIGKTGSFAQAAVQRHVTPPAFGRRIRTLEAWAGMPLVDRSRKPLQLTEAGKKLMLLTQETLQGLHDARQQLQRTPQHDNVLKVATGRTLARTWVADWLAQILRSAKLEQIQIRTGGLADTLNWLEQGQADLLVAYHHPAIAQRPRGRGFLQKVLARDKLVPVRRRLITTRSRQAEAWPLLGYAPSLALSGLLADHLERCPCPETLHTTLECDSADALLEYAVKGLGVCWLPWSLSATACQQGLLEVCWGRSMEIPFEVRLVRIRKKLSTIAEEIWQLTPEHVA
jgi:LysR family transcriptional regulator, hypochlorite-specific transcription factor HypT